MSNELEALRRLRKCLEYGDDELGDVHYSNHIKDLDIIRTSLEALEIIKDNFTLCVEPNYKVTLQFQQHTSMTQSDYEKIIEYFGEPRNE